MAESRKEDYLVTLDKLPEGSQARRQAELFEEMNVEDVEIYKVGLVWPGLLVTEYEIRIADKTRMYFDDKGVLAIFQAE